MRKRIHIVRRWPCGGGMQRVLEQHLEAGESLVAISGEPCQEAEVRQLGVLPGTSLREASGRLQEVLERQEDADCLLYNACALDWMAPLRGNQRRVAYLHSDYPRMEKWMHRLAACMHGCLCVNSRTAGTVRRVTGLPPAAVHVLPLPVEPLLPSGHGPPGPGSPLVIGYSGRVEKPQKRLDRLPELLEKLDHAGLDFRMEILGSGGYLNALKEQCKGNTRVVFHGHKEGKAYWEVIRKWKYILFLSDYEGLPIALLEGVACGAVPVYPDFHNGSDWVSGLGTGFLYPCGDIRAATEIISRIEASWTEENWQAYRDKALEVREGHTRAAYFSAVDAALDHMPLPGAKIRERTMGLPGWCPFWMHNRLRHYRQFGHFRRGGGT